MPQKSLHRDNYLPNIQENGIFDYAEQLGLGEIHIKLNRHHQLRAIVAIHNTEVGPAIGGCRFIQYDSTQAAIFDALRLAQGMAYKAAVCGLPHGGAKSVLIKPPSLNNRKALFESFGRFLNDLQGKYLVAVDSGTTTEDMDTIATQTKHVLCTNQGDPSPYTALGIFKSIQAAVKHQRNQTNLDNLHVAIQGVGNVGYHLAKLLHQQGAKLTITDSNLGAIERAKNEFKANVVTPEAIYDVDCDIFSPCALGACLNETTIPKIKAKIIAGAANNQLAKPEHGDTLKNLGILYAPDYVANAGGLIYAASLYSHTSEEQVLQQVDKVYDSLLKIFKRSDKDNCSTSFIADTIAEEILIKSKKP